MRVSRASSPIPLIASALLLVPNTRVDRLEIAATARVLIQVECGHEIGKRIITRKMRAL